MLGNPRTLFQKALRGKYAIGAFNVNDLEFVEAVVAAAEAQRSPVILQTSEGAIAYAGMEMLVAVMRVAAQRAKVPVIMHLDHGKDLKIVKQAIAAGYTSIMFDGSSLPYAENVAKTKQVVKWARAKGILVEAELGAIKGVEDFVSVAERDATFTSPEQALDFVERTGCDSLAVSIGTAHGAFKYKPEAGSRKPEATESNALPASSFKLQASSFQLQASSSDVLDIARLRRIHAMIPKTPLVLHGASSIPEELVGETELYCSMLGDCKRLEGAKGVPDQQVRAAIANGVCKVNTDTDLRIAFTAGIREAIIENRKEIDPRKILGPAREKIQKITEQRIRVFGSAGKATRYLRLS